MYITVIIIKTEYHISSQTEYDKGALDNELRVSTFVSNTPKPILKSRQYAVWGYR